MSDETFKIPVAPKQRLYPLTECNVGNVGEREGENSWGYLCLAYYIYKRDRKDVHK